MSLSKSQINALFETVERAALSHLNVCAQKQRTLTSISEAVSQRMHANSPGVKTAVNLILKKLVKEGTVVIEKNPQNSDRYFITENILNEAFRAAGIGASNVDEVVRMSSVVSGQSSYEMNEGVLSVTRTPYGMTIEDESKKDVRIGRMVLELLTAGDANIFNTPQGVSADLLSNLMSQHDMGVQGGMINWDPDVFRDYYDVDLDRVLTLYARLTNQTIKENPYKE